ncbi:TrkH family potassium uptake protein [uncultured Oscillibacter sp.]|uniref:TrkH family potassium uptake protein n=1 Tax=uncultured Oscillibacter sp. TaxID=876091 RepID=UPI0025F0DD43|nr:potassium transporter TrkG [uncultured Oscillibacter sp.]
MKQRRFSLNAVQNLALSFACIILLGGLLLTLPIASRSGQPLPFLDALFTSASATCVTGLVLYDTWTQFTLFGQVVILLLIQVGGLSFMTVTIFISMLLGRRIGLHSRAVLMDTVGALQMAGIVRLTRRILKVTAVCEGLGALALLFWFCPRYGLRGIWMSVFHAVSAFCNAGFDLLGTGTSLTTAAGEPLLNIVLMLLIISGGLGFLVWDDILTHKFRFSKWRLHSKVAFTGTLAALVLGTAAFYILEGDYAFAGVPSSQKLLMAAFQSVTPRTAGFNTADLMALSESGKLLTMILMFIGAGSGSTGGGIKINTFAVLVLSALARVRRREDVELFGRRLDSGDIYKAFSVVSMYFMTCMAGCMVLCLDGISMDGALFESLSAMGTVGLTLGVTPTLPTASKIVVTLMMFAGRVGSMTVLMAMVRDRPAAKLRKIPEKILIG